MKNGIGVIAVVQARLGSTRLPGKVLMKVLQKPVLWWIVNQLRHSNKIDQIVVATTHLAADDAIDEFCRNEGLDCYRGSVDDIVDRMYQASLKYSPETIVRITGDDVFKDPEQIDYMLTEMKRTGAVVAVNNQPPTFPYGLDLDIVKYDVLKDAWAELKGQNANGEDYLKFVTNDERYNVLRVTNDTDLSKLRWTIDYRDDFLFAENIIEAFIRQRPGKQFFLMKDVLEVQKALSSDSQ